MSVVEESQSRTVIDVYRRVTLSDSFQIQTSVDTSIPVRFTERVEETTLGLGLTPVSVGRVEYPLFRLRTSPLP